MNFKDDTEKTFSAESEADNAASVDDFLRELEEKEKDLNISSDIVIEVDESEFSETDIPEFLQTELSDHKSPQKNQTAPSFAPPVEKMDNGEILQLRRQVSELENDYQALTTTLMRRQTDFENYRKRIERERGDTFIGQVGNLAIQLLPVLDNLNRALDAAANLPGEQSQNFQHFFDGIILVNQQLNEILSEMGVEPIAAVGEPFDPHFHDAVATEESDTFSPHTVIAELLRGYRISDKVIRPAMVKVASAKNSTPAPESTDAEQINI